MPDDILQIDIDRTLRARAPRHYRYVPRFAVRQLERLVCQDQLNDMLRKIGNRHGVDAADTVLHELGIGLTAQGLENIPTEGRFIFASNHPLGGLDGLALISLFGHRYSGEIRFLVNDLLMAVKPLNDIFLPVNKFGRQSRDAAALIEAEYAGDRQMLTFPAGLCSRRQSDGTIADLKWHKFVVTRAIEHRRDIIPVYFDGQNSKRFYRIAQWRKRLGIKFNIEQMLLPSEIFRSQGAAYTIYIGSPVAWQTLDKAHAQQWADRLRRKVYQLKL